MRFCFLSFVLPQMLPGMFLALPLLTGIGAAMGEEPKTIRIATYNASLYGKGSNEVLERLRDQQDPQAQKVAAIVQTVRPDILLINEIDHHSDGSVARLLAENYFSVSQSGRKPVDYPFVVSLPSNTGVDSGLDLNRNGKTNEPNDAWGFGFYPGQYAMAIFSQYPIDEGMMRTFQKYLWKDLPAALRPVDPQTGQSYYNDAVWSKLRLSSKNHVDVPIRLGGAVVHILASHPTPPVFDGAEDRNGCRNHDEIRFWINYLSESSEYLIDDRGRRGGLTSAAMFVIMGDLNSDPDAGDSRRDAIQDLLNHPKVNDPRPRSDGAAEEAAGRTATAGDPSRHTASFGGNRNMRIDYVLPCRRLTLQGSGVYWPQKDAPDRGMIAASDHRLVWVDVVVPQSHRP